MATVITPTALATSNFREIKLSEYPNTDCDEAFVFIFPSPNIINEENGDGDLIEVTDYKKDFSQIETERGSMAATPETCLYVR